MCWYPCKGTIRHLMDTAKRREDMLGSIEQYFDVFTYLTTSTWITQAESGRWVDKLHYSRFNVATQSVATH